MTPEHWGLHAFEPPHLAVPDARPVWCAKAYPYVLTVDAIQSDGENAFDLQRVVAVSPVLVAARRREHLLLSDGHRAIRLDVQGASLAKGPVQLRYRLAGLSLAEAPLLTLRRFLAFVRSGRFSRTLYRPEARARRLVLMLRAHDALRSGATQREIAAELLSGEARADRWRVNAPALRSQVQRLVRDCRFMAEGGYASLLRVSSSAAADGERTRGVQLRSAPPSSRPAL